jgi:hypothetical protein
MWHKIIIFILSLIVISGCVSIPQEPVDNTKSCCTTCIYKDYNDTDELCINRYHADKDIRGCYNIFGENNLTVGDCLDILT